MEKIVIEEMPREVHEFSDDKEEVVLYDEYKKLWEYKEHLEVKLKSMVSSSNVSECYNCKGYGYTKDKYGRSEGHCKVCNVE